MFRIWFQRSPVSQGLWNQRDLFHTLDHLTQDCAFWILFHFCFPLSKHIPSFHWKGMTPLSLDFVLYCCSLLLGTKCDSIVEAGQVSWQRLLSLQVSKIAYLNTYKTVFPWSVQLLKQLLEVSSIPWLGVQDHHLQVCYLDCRCKQDSDGMLAFG